MLNDAARGAPTKTTHVARISQPWVSLMRKKTSAPWTLKGRTRRPVSSFLYRTDGRTDKSNNL